MNIVELEILVPLANFRIQDCQQSVASTHPLTYKKQLGYPTDQSQQDSHTDTETRVRDKKFSCPAFHAAICLLVSGDGSNLKNTGKESLIKISFTWFLGSTVRKTKHQNANTTGIVYVKAQLLSATPILSPCHVGGRGCSIKLPPVSVMLTSILRKSQSMPVVLGYHNQDAMHITNSAGSMLGKGLNTSRNCQGGGGAQYPALPYQWKKTGRWKLPLLKSRCRLSTEIKNRDSKSGIFSSQWLFGFKKFPNPSTNKVLPSPKTLLNLSFIFLLKSFPHQPAWQNDSTDQESSWTDIMWINFKTFLIVFLFFFKNV